MKLDYRKTALIGFGLFSANIIWVIYNTYVPIFLQAGAPAFDSQLAVHTFGFGLSATITGVIMTLDNVAAFFIQPIMGPISDRTYTRIGRRMPYIIVCVPIAVLAFALIPLAPMLIPAPLNGQVDQLGGLFAFFIVAIGVTLLAMAVFRTPLLALMPDLVPSPLRSQANAVINLMGGIGGIVAFLIGGMLYGIYRPLPFWVAGVVILLAVGILFWKVKEPRKLVESAAEHEKGVRDILRGLRDIPRENAASLALLILTIFFYMMGFNAIETFFSSYGVATLGVNEATAGMMLSAAYISFIIFALPSGWLATRIGRKRTMMLGELLFAGLLLVGFFVPNAPVIVALLALAGIAWAMININSLPMVVDISPTDEVMGTYTGLYFVAATLAAVLGPIVNGWIIDLTGRNYNMIFLVTPVFFVLAFLCMLGVTKGEAKSSTA
ncbi:MAG: MFS transporter [Chloroflexi bacterium]|nr:MFS transporter [Chloroflexota bacterium]MBU1748931.1 MFS transporter [Chloroflexota bacterium]MBU1878455.1 MFS transporter [Chloroflexota bacterium]